MVKLIKSSACYAALHRITVFIASEGAITLPIVSLLSLLIVFGRTSGLL